MKSSIPLFLIFSVLFISCSKNQQQQNDLSLIWENRNPKNLELVANLENIILDTYPQYNFFVRNAEHLKPEENLFIITDKNVLGDKSFYWPCMIDADGKIKIIFSDKNQKKYFIEFFHILGGFCYGEYTDILLRTYPRIPQQEITSLIIRLVPFPIEAKAEDGAVVSLFLENAECDIYTMFGEGFKSYENLEIISISGEEVIDYAFKTNGDGTLYGTILPAVIGETGGEAELTIIRKNGKLKLKYPWGDHNKPIKHVESDNEE